jgi:hypothetical protein
MGGELGVFRRVSWAIVACSACNSIAGIDLPHDRADGAPAAQSDASKLDATLEPDATREAATADAVDAPCSTWTDCAGGQYCDELGSCRSCGDITTIDDAQIRFAPPESLSAVNDNATTELVRLPRLAADGVGLFYVRDFFATRIWATESFARNAGGPIGAPVDEADLTESAPLVPTFETRGTLAGHQFFFDRNVSKTDTRRELYGASLDANGAMTGVTRLPAPFNAPTPTVQWNSAIAVSRDRAWWMWNQDGKLQIYLVTAPLTEGAKATVVSINTPPGCPLREIDTIPWVTPDGAMLLVTGTQRDASCTATTQRTDIFRVRVDASGQPLAAGSALEGIDEPMSGETDASLSADLCWLYFSSDRGADARFRLYRAHRGR